jgi:tetratricopeptide (TPR) repeat protein
MATGTRNGDSIFILTVQTAFSRLKLGKGLLKGTTSTDSYRGKEEIVNKLFTVMAVLAMAAMVGCSSGGGGTTVETDTSADVSGSSTDSQGFERNLGPAEIAYQSAQQFMSAGNYTEAITNLEKAVSIKPTYLEAWSDLGRAYTDRKDYEQGIEAYKKALELAPGNEALIASIGYNYLNLDDFDNAETYYLMLVEEDSLNYNGNVNLAFIAQRRDDTRGAISYYERALRSNPKDATTMGTLASLYGKLGSKEKKYEYLQMAIDAAPENYQFKKQLALAYFQEKNYESAIPLYEALAMEFPDDANYHQRLGFALSQTDRKAEAPAELEKAIELSGGDPFTYAILAKIYNENKLYQKAADAAKAGLALGGGEVAFLTYQWGEALSKLEDYEGAMAKFEKVAGMGDDLWSAPAAKQVDRQQKLIKIREAKKEQEQYE